MAREGGLVREQFGARVSMIHRREGPMPHMKEVRSRACFPSSWHPGLNPVGTQSLESSRRKALEAVSLV